MYGLEVLFNIKFLLGLYLLMGYTIDINHA